MSKRSRISARISTATKDKLDRFAPTLGLDKSFVVERADEMEQRELPEEAFIPARIVLDDDAFARVVALVESAPPPTTALRQLMRGRRG
jgi:uncharacterized protein (DUF1778 family)